MRTITFSTPAPKYQSKIVADVSFPVIAYLNRVTVDGRKLLPPNRAEITIPLPVNIMTDYSKGPARPNLSQISKYRMIGALLEVTISDHTLTGTGVLYRPLPDHVLFYAAVDIAPSVVKVFNNGRINFHDWALRAVTLRDHGPAWPNLPPAIIVPR